MIPEATPDAIRRAMRQFDRELRDQPEWVGWESRRNFKFALEEEGKRYPVKQIVAMATGTSRRSFSGGGEANSYLSSRGFAVSRIRKDTDDEIRGRIEKILETYLTIRTTKPFGTEPDLWSAFDGICSSLRLVPSIASNTHLKVSWAVGQGNWTHVPYIPILDDRETTTPQKGVYCVFLFRADMSGAYLTFNQGVTEPLKRLGPAAGLEEVRTKRVELRGIAGSLRESGFKLDDAIDLRVEAGKGKNYESSTVAYKLYEKGAVPNDEDIVDDVEAVLDVYEAYVAKRGQSALGDAANNDNEVAPGLDPSLDTLSAFIRAAALQVSEELVANYVLALSTKRFVIMSGLSGTGKTQLAIKTAEFFQPKVQTSRVVNVPQGSELVQLRPYMFLTRPIFCTSRSERVYIAFAPSKVEG